MGKLRVTVTFDVNVASLEDFEAATLEQAAENLRAWYADGSASVVDDYADATEESTTIGVEAVGD